MYIYSYVHENYEYYIHTYLENPKKPAVVPIMSIIIIIIIIIIIHFQINL